MSDLQDRIALVIGGAAGIGQASARALAAKGATAIVADRDGEGAQQAADEIKAAGGAALAYQVDFSQGRQLEAMFAFIAETYGRLHVMFSNVGTRCANGFAVTDADFDHAFSLNLRSHFFATNLAAPLMQTCAPHASIIYMSSGAGFRYFGRSPLYSMSKASLLMMAKAFSQHLGPQGIRVNALCPGAVNTAFPSQGVDPEVRRARVEQMSREIPLRRIAEPEDVANVVAFLASDESSYLTGLSIPIDGGLLS